MKNFFSHWRNDLPSSLVVFLVALPLCLGVALASTGAKPILFSGIIAGVVGGVVVGFFSGSKLGVSGPAAGLITIVLAAITTLGSFESFLVAVILAGFIQLIAGFIGAGVLGNFFPSAVIKGMLAAIGLTLILKEIPHLVGYDKDFMGDESFFQFDGHNTFSDLMYATNALSPGAMIIAAISIFILVFVDKPFMKKWAVFKILPGALFVVVLGIGINLIFHYLLPDFEMKGQHLVQLPVAKSLEDFGSFFIFPDFMALKNPKVYVVALTIALVASLETLLSVEATDKLDPDKNFTPTNRELRAQGIGNIFSGLLGGLPITQVIVRSSANINSGGKSKLSTILHGFLLLICALFIPQVLNLIPFASLAAILLMVGYKLSKISLYKSMYQLGFEQFIPFISTILGVLFTDLLKGIAIGIDISIFYILRKNLRNNFQKNTISNEGREEIEIILSEEVTFLNKGGIIELIQNVPNNATLIIDGSKSKTIDYDVLELIQEFKVHGAKTKNIILKTINIPEVEISGSH
jgi:MFS superfamily sulfate permease-like transporter